MREIIQKELDGFIEKRKVVKEEMKKATGKLELIECRQRIIMIDEIISIKKERLKNER